VFIRVVELREQRAAGCTVDLSPSIFFGTWRTDGSGNFPVNCYDPYGNVVDYYPQGYLPERESDRGACVFQIPAQSDTNTTFQITFEGVDYLRASSAPRDLSQFMYRGLTPVAYSNDAQTVGYLVNLNQNTPYTINQDSFINPYTEYPAVYSALGSTCGTLINVPFVSTVNGHWMQFTNFVVTLPVHILWNGADITGTTTNTVIVGQQVNNLQAVLDHSLPAASNFSWSVSSYAISNYVEAGDSSSAHVLPLVQTNNATISYYWVNGGQKNVTCSVLLNNGSIVTGSASFVVQSPTVNNFTSTTGPIVVGNSFGSLQLPFGTNGPSNTFGTPGINYTAQITTPPSIGGQLKFMQTLTADFQETFTNNSTESLIASGWWLDGADPYGGSTYGPYTISGGTTFTMGNNDSPGAYLLSGYKKMNVITNNFSLFLMFEPSGNSTWVPLSEISWGWTAIAQSTNGGVTWTKTSGSSNAVNPSGSTTTNFPEWSNVYTPNVNPVWQPD
jgi:hypothetical protein